MNKNLVSFHVRDMYELMTAIYHDYLETGQEHLLSHALALGGIEEGRVTQKQLDDGVFDPWYEMAVGMQYFNVLSGDELMKRFGK
jgi:hypothetical protein